MEARRLRRVLVQRRQEQPLRGQLVRVLVQRPTLGQQGQQPGQQGQQPGQLVPRVPPALARPVRGQQRRREAPTVGQQREVPTVGQPGQQRVERTQQEGERRMQRVHQHRTQQEHREQQRVE